MFWKKFTRVSAFCLALLAVSLAGSASGAAPVRKIRALDADNHNILLNRPSVVTLLIGTSAGSQDAAREAGILVYPFQGRTDFQLIVAVDLHDSLAVWAPGMAVSRMKASLDDEALELKPYYMKNGNRNNPRFFCHVVPDFTGKLFAQLGWPNSSDDLRAIVYGSDGREYKRFDKVNSMNVLFNTVRAALADYIELRRAHLAAAPPVPDTRSSSALSPAMPPLPPPLPVGP